MTTVDTIHHNDDGPGDDHRVMIYADGKKCDDGQCKDVMIASLVVSAAQSHGRSDDGQCLDRVGQCDIIGQRVMVVVDDGQRDDHIGQ